MDEKGHYRKHGLSEEGPGTVDKRLSSRKNRKISPMKKKDGMEEGNFVSVRSP